MLPSTGYFKAINCPFYESGTCDRPYCHFKHSKREDAGVSAEASETVENRSTSQVQDSKATAIAASDSDVLQQLVTEAVQKVLATRTSGEVDQFSDVASQVAEVFVGLKPGLVSATSDVGPPAATENRTDASSSMGKSLPCVYNPTPIAELKKRHIPIVSYMPTRESRVAVKRKCSPDGIKPWSNVANERVESQAGEVKYKPTTIVNLEARDTAQSYVPTCKSDSSLASSCNDAPSNDYLSKLREAYHPRCKKRREEYVPKKVKAPLKSVDGLNESTVDSFKAELDAIGQAFACVESSRGPDSGQLSRNLPVDFEPKFSDDEEDDKDAKHAKHAKHARGDSSNPDNGQDETRDERKAKDAAYVGGEAEKSDRSSDAQDIDADLAVLAANRESVVEEKRNASEAASREEASKPWESEKGKACEAMTETETEAEAEAEAEVEAETEVEVRKGSSGKSAKERESKPKSDRRYKDRRDSNEKTRSSSRSHSRSRSKAKSRSRDESKQSKDKKYSSRSNDRGKCKEGGKAGEKHREKEREKERSKRERKEDGGSARKKRDVDPKNCSKDGGGHRTKEKSNGSEKRSTADRKSDEKAVGGSRDSRDSRESRSHSKQQRKSANSVDPCPLGDSQQHDYDDCYGDDDYAAAGEIDVDLISVTSDSDHDVQEECLKIFQEYQVSERSRSTERSKEPALPIEKEKEVKQSEEIGRKRVAHPSAAGCVTRQVGVSQQPKKSVNPQQKMYERWRLMRDAVAEKTICGSSGISKDGRRMSTETMGPASNAEFKLNGNGRVRIAHVPYAKSLAIEKKKVTENAGKSVETKGTDNWKTAAQTAKSGVRVAHVPQVVPQLIRPEPLQVTTQKFPLNVRQYYVNMMHDVCVSIYTNAEDAAQRAVKEEFACHERCKALAVYKNSCMLATHRLRKEADQNTCAEGSATLASAGTSVMSHEAVLAGKSKGSWSVLKTKRSVTEFRGAALYGMLKKWIMTEQQLRDNGFPRPHPDGQKGRAKVYVTNSRNQNVVSKVPNERICSRCGQSYTIDKQGFALQAQNCIYHWGRKFTIRGEGKYSCCQQYGWATGCCDAKTHVWDYTDYENLRGYVKTLPKDTPVEEQGVFALDCEMCYTTQGLELTRITVIDDDCNVVYETLVKPQNPIIDYNTRFSGITEESMKDVTRTLLDVQATLLTMFSENTILVGHSLESDFKALRLLHDTVVDTSVMFPHKNGYPQKRALKNLCSEYLRKIIQNDVGGHDSKEDAVACMELILWKAKEEAKLQ